MTQQYQITRRTLLFGMAGVATSLCLPVNFANAKTFQFEPFSFAYVADVHLVNGVPDSFKLTQESQLFLQNAIKQINELGVDFVVFGGDQVETPGNDDKNWNLFLDIAQGLSMPWYFVLGERDVSGIVPADKIKTYGPDWKRRDLKADLSYWSFDYSPGVHLIGLDTSKANSDEGVLAQEQLTWLQSDLNDSKNKFTIVFSHHPLLAPQPFDSGPPWDRYLVPQGASAREILNSSNGVRLVVNGHIHTSKIQRERDIWYVSSPSLDVYPCEFRTFRINPENIEVESYQVDYPALVKKAKSELATSRMAFDYSSGRPATFLSIADGEHLDQIACLPIASGKTALPLKPSKVAKKPKDQKPAGKEKPEKSKPETKPETKPEQKPDTKSDTDAKPNMDLKPESDGKPDAPPKPDPEVKSDTNVKPDIDAKPAASSSYEPKAEMSDPTKP